MCSFIWSRSRIHTKRCLPSERVRPASVSCECLASRLRLRIVNELTLSRGMPPAIWPLLTVLPAVAIAILWTDDSIPGCGAVRICTVCRWAGWRSFLALRRVRTRLRLAGFVDQSTAEKQAAVSVETQSSSGGASGNTASVAAYSEGSRETVSKFIAGWSASGGAERANFPPFARDLCDILGVPHPEPTKPDVSENAYVFERDVEFHNLDSSTSVGRIDLYKRGCFVLEAKQGTEKTDADADDALKLTSQPKKKTKRGTAVRRTKGWDDAMVKARG